MPATVLTVCTPPTKLGHRPAQAGEPRQPPPATSAAFDFPVPPLPQRHSQPCVAASQALPPVHCRSMCARA